MADERLLRTGFKIQIQEKGYEMSKNEIAKHYILFTVSLFFAAMGVAFTKRAELGVSPISSVVNVMSIRFTFLTLGTWLIIWNCVLIVGQIILLRRKFDLIQLMQIPLSLVFGWFTDFGMWVVSFIPVNSYIMQLFMVLIGIAILGFGISLSVIANVIMNSGEAFVKAIADITGKNFGNIKIAFDVTCVIVSVILSLLFFDLQIIGTREGTIISALLTGVFVKLFVKLLQKPIEGLLAKK